MSVRELLAKEIENVPEPLLEELLDFARFLRTKAERSGPELAILERILPRQRLVVPNPVRPADCMRGCRIGLLTVRFPSAGSVVRWLEAGR